MMAYSCQVFSGASLMYGDLKALFDDPLQGQSGDCCLIAALSAVAWTLGGSKISIKDNGLTPDNPGAYTVMLNTVAQKVSGKLSLDFSLPMPFKYAHSRVPSEIWPGLYEKAYAMKYFNAAADCDLSGVNWEYNPTNYLRNLSGCTARLKNANLSTEIINRCLGGKIKYPMVIWNPNHCYTVLGQMPNNGPIVLRDPSLQNIPPNAITGLAWYITDHFLLNCSTSTRIASQGTFTLNLNNGVFGMTTANINQYFTNLTYAGPV